MSTQMNKMTKKQAAEILREHNRWRRAEGKYACTDVVYDYPSSPTEIGQAIDFAVAHLSKKSGGKSK